MTTEPRKNVGLVRGVKHIATQWRRFLLDSGGDDMAKSGNCWGGCLHLRPPNQNFWGGRVPPVPPIIAAPVAT